MSIKPLANPRTASAKSVGVAGASRANRYCPPSYSEIAGIGRHPKSSGDIAFATGNLPLRLRLLRIRIRCRALRVARRPHQRPDRQGDGAPRQEQQCPPGSANCDHATSGGRENRTRVQRQANPTCANRNDHPGRILCVCSSYRICGHAGDDAGEQTRSIRRSVPYRSRTAGRMWTVHDAQYGPYLATEGWGLADGVA